MVSKIELNRKSDPDHTAHDASDANDMMPCRHICYYRDHTYATSIIRSRCPSLPLLQLIPNRLFEDPSSISIRSSPLSPLTPKTMTVPAFLPPTPLRKPITTPKSLNPLTTKKCTRRPRFQPHATAAAASRSPPPPRPPTWRTDQNLDLYIPANPSLILIFTGGLAASLSPRTTYSAFLTAISSATQAAILAHRTPPSTDHARLARTVATDLAPHLQALRDSHPNIPTFTIGHSLGAKLSLLTSTDHTTRHALGHISANVLISFCNRSAADAVPWANQGKTRAADTLSQVSNFLSSMDIDMFGDPRAGDVRKNITNVIDAVQNSLRADFAPTPDETLALVGSRYHIRRNLVISFDRDDLDDAPQLVRVLRSRFGDSGVIVRTLPGTHVTPMTPELGNEFYGTGNEQVNRWVREKGDGVGKELDRLIAVVAAFLKLQLQITE